MLKIDYTNTFKRSYKKCLKNNLKEEDIKEVMIKLVNEIPLEEKYREHMLIGEYKKCMECHIKPDWLLIYRKTSVEIIFIDTGTHSDLFK